jgi:hypothetical protein
MDQQAVLATPEPEPDSSDQEYRADDDALTQEKTTTKADGIRRRRGSITDVGWKRLMHFR